MLRLLERVLYEKDYSVKNSVGIYAELVEDGLLLHCVSRGFSSSKEPVFFEQSIGFENTDSVKNHGELEKALLYVSFSPLEFKFIRMNFDNMPLKPKEQKKFLLWRLAQEWGINEKTYSIQYFVFPREEGYQVLVHACDLRVEKAINLVADSNQALIVQSRPQITRQISGLFLSDDACNGNGIVFYLQSSCWSIASWSEKNEVDFLRSQPIQCEYGVAQAFLDFELLCKKRLLENDVPPKVYIVYDASCGSDLKEQVKKLLGGSTLKVEELSRENDFDYPSWQMRYADNAISI